ARGGRSRRAVHAGLGLGARQLRGGRDGLRARRGGARGGGTFSSARDRRRRASHRAFSAHRPPREEILGLGSRVRITPQAARSESGALDSRADHSGVDVLDRLEGARHAVLARRVPRRRAGHDRDPKAADLLRRPRITRRQRSGAPRRARLRLLRGADRADDTLRRVRRVAAAGRRDLQAQPKARRHAYPSGRAVRRLARSRTPLESRGRTSRQYAASTALSIETARAAAPIPWACSGRTYIGPANSTSLSGT